jgi:hypothetical protein
MIHEILPSDVEFTRGMINSSHTDAEILACLASRGIGPAEAAALVDDLRHGREPSAEMPFRLGQRGPAATGRPQAAARDAPPQSHPERHRSHHRRSHRSSGMPWWFVLLVLVFLLALAYALFLAGSSVSTNAVDTGRHEIPPAPGK